MDNSIRRYLDLIESSFLVEGSLWHLLDQPQFCDAVRKYMQDGLSDWIDDYKDDKVLIEAARNVLHQIESLGSLTGDRLAVWRAELRPNDQIKNRNFGSVGCYWTWHGDSARVCHHDNCYDQFGRKGISEITFEAEVSVNDVDWIAVIAQNLCLPNEREITVKDGAHVAVQAMYAGRDFVELDLTLPVTGNR